MDFEGLEKLRIPKTIAKPPESLEYLQILKTLSGLIAQKTLKKSEQLENAQHKKEMLETLRTQHNYKNQEHVNNKEIQEFERQRCPALRAATFPRILCTSAFFTRSNLAAWPGPAAARPGPARPSGRLTSVQPLPGDSTEQKFGCRPTAATSEVAF